MRTRKILFAALPLLAMLLTGCVKYNGRSSSNPSREEMTLRVDKNSMSLTEGQQGKIKATVDKDAEVNWSIDNELVATLDVAKGLEVTVSALNQGNAVITATSSFEGKAYSTTCLLTVNRKGEGGGGGGGGGGQTPGPDTPVEGETVTTYLVIGENGRYKGEKGIDIPSVYLEYAVEFTAKVGEALPTKDDVTSIVTDSVFQGWQSYEGGGALTKHTVVPNARGKILYASFGGGQGEAPIEPDPEVPQGSVTLYFAGIASWTDATDVHLGINGNFVTATQQTDKTYKAVVNVTGNIETVNAYLSQNDAKYFHPTSGTKDYDQMYSRINVGSINVEFDGKYTITFIDWDYSNDDWSHAWFKYSFTAGEPGPEPEPPEPIEPGENSVSFVFAGIETWQDATDVHFIVDGSDKVATKQSNGKYTVEFTVSTVSKLQCYMHQTGSNEKYFHPYNGSYDKMNSDIDTGNLAIAPGHVYVVTYTGWHDDSHWEHEGNVEHGWFEYTFTLQAAD